LKNRTYLILPFFELSEASFSEVQVYDVSASKLLQCKYPEPITCHYILELFCSYFTAASIPVSGRSVGMSDMEKVAISAAVCELTRGRAAWNKRALLGGAICQEVSR